MLYLKQISILVISLTLFTACSHTNSPLVIAHRGASGHLPEHTLAAAALAHSWEADFIEADLVLTKDNHLIVLHDLYLDATTDVRELFPNRKRSDGRYYAIDFSLAEIKQLNVYERRSPKTQKVVYHERFNHNSSGFKIPTFKEFVILVQSLNKTTNENIGLYPEIKKPEFHLKEGKDITKIFALFLRDHQLTELSKTPLFIQCFWPKTLKRLKNEFNIKHPLVQLLAENSWRESSADYSHLRSKKGLREISEYAQAIGPWLGHTDIKLIENAKNLGLKVHAYTHRRDQVPKAHTAQSYRRYLKSLKLDGIFTDFPDDF